MGMGRRPAEAQNELWMETRDIVTAPGHPFYDRLNKLLREARFDDFVEDLCEPYYVKGGRPSIPPGTYFRMVFIDYFEGIDSQRQTAWRCQDSLTLRKFLGYPLNQPTPDHSSLTRIRQRLPQEVYNAVFVFVLNLCDEHGLLSGTLVGVDATTLEANAAMKAIVRRDTDEDWQEYVKRLMAEDGLFDPDNEDDEPSDPEIRRFDRQRKGKKVSNEDWKSPTDDDARIIKMKDGRTRLGYKAEHVVDLKTEAILSANVYHGHRGDTDTISDSLSQAQRHLEQTEQQPAIQEVVADKGYHSNQVLLDCVESELRTYIPEPESGYERCWTDKWPEEEAAYRGNRRRMQGNRGKRLQRIRSELAERSFAHVCETGGSRRSWLRGLLNINKRYLMQAAARNLGLILRKLLGSGTPRGLAAAARSIFMRCFVRDRFSAVMNCWETLTTAHPSPFPLLAT